MRISSRITAAAALLAVCTVFKAAALDFPEMPSVSAPAMPELSNSSPFRQTQTNRKTDTAAQKNQTQTSQTALNLTAQQISNLGGLNVLGSLTGNDQISQYLSGLTGNTAAVNAAGGTSGTQNAVLTAILQQLSKIADQTADKAASGSMNPSAAVYDTTQTGAVQSAQKGSRILRFRVNGTDILGSCSQLYFSEPSESGFFLLTGDRFVLSNNRKYNETFYLLFKPQKTNSGAVQYSVEADLMQESDNADSYLYRMTQKSPFTALRTGNLISLKSNEADWKLDLLIDLQEE